MSILDTKLRYAFSHIVRILYADLQYTYTMILTLVPIRNTYCCTVLWYININTKYELSLYDFFLDYIFNCIIEIYHHNM